VAVAVNAEAQLMSTVSSHRNRFAEWAVISRACPGEEVSGDLHVVAPSAAGIVAGVVDGLGHGVEALAAARAAVAVLSEHREESVIALVHRCHRALQATRGAVMTVISLNARDQTLTALGIGNVEAILLRGNPKMQPAHESVLLRNGVAGYRLPALQASVFPVAPGDVIIFATDGIRAGFLHGAKPTDSPEVLVERILQQSFRGNDDALVLAIRFGGAAHG